ncbi:hydrolase [Rubrobacter tropicus]|uniref:Hydrolase n=1 Tax=Rubrobacter tropicus TaxID=2653851 RepID=A0A6G8QCD8_9ACTN|nr:SGNH/GDSL hydrolase family protein [Rubrobacter tropicus]QIN84160.1 hydrolase [Rubrobacter tropicus]
MRTILCYGDSNTWGSDPETGERFSEEVRWPGVLARELGDGFRVVEEGLSGRTTVRDDPIEGVHKNGRTYLRACLESHKPIDLVTVMLGTNDLKERFGASASDIAQGAASLAEEILRSGCGPGGGAPVVLLMAPPPVGKLTDMAEMFEGSREKSARFAGHYRRFAEQYGCEFLDAGAVISSSDIDGIHLEAEEHRKLGEAVAARVEEIL